MEQRRDNKGRILLIGEVQEKTGLYTFRYTDKFGNRKKISSWRLTNADATPLNKQSKPALRDLEKEIRRCIESGIANDGISVIELVDRYISTKVNVSHNTRAGYKTVHNVLVKEAFGKKRIDQVKYSEALLFIQKLQKDGRSYSSVQSIRGVLRPAFQMALRDELIMTNPFSFELGDALINDSIKREALSKENERKFLEFVRNDNHFSRYYEGIYILFKTGLRISEFCGLTIGDVDFKKHELNVDHQLQRERNGRYVITTTKTQAGKRVLPMRPDVEECFKTIINKRKTPKVEPMVDGYAGFLYLDQNNNPSLAGHWAHYFKFIREKYNKIYKIQMPMVSPHVCRHTYCSNIAKNGMSAKTLQYLMGHSDITVTLGIYTHYGLEDVKIELE